MKWFVRKNLLIFFFRAESRYVFSPWMVGFCTQRPGTPGPKHPLAIKCWVLPSLSNHTEFPVKWVLNMNKSKTCHQCHYVFSKSATASPISKSQKMLWRGNVKQRKYVMQIPTFSALLVQSFDLFFLEPTPHQTVQKTKTNDNWKHFTPLGRCHS